MYEIDHLLFMQNEFPKFPIRKPTRKILFITADKAMSFSNIGLYNSLKRLQKMMFPIVESKKMIMMAVPG